MQKIHSGDFTGLGSEILRRWSIKRRRREIISARQFLFYYLALLICCIALDPGPLAQAISRFWRWLRVDIVRRNSPEPELNQRNSRGLLENLQ